MSGEASRRYPPRSVARSITPSVAGTSPAAERVERGLGTALGVYEPRPHLVAPRAGRLVEELEVDERLDPAPAPRDAQGTVYPVGLRRPRHPEVEGPAHVARGHGVLAEEELDLLVPRRSSEGGVHPSGQRVEVVEVGEARADERPGEIGAAG